MLTTETEQRTLSSNASTPEQDSGAGTLNGRLAELSLTVVIPAGLTYTKFATQIGYYLERLSERLGIAYSLAEQGLSNEAMILRLVGAGWQVQSSIELKDEGGCFIAEETLQAVAGIAEIHGRCQGQPALLSMDYATVAVATNALTGLLAQAYAQLQAPEFSQCTQSYCSPLATSLLGTSQYIADATAAEPFPLPDGAGNGRLQPPFCSLDGVIFELETLDAGPWREFWLSLGICGQVSAKGWKAFQMRYAKAVSPLPESMVQCLAQQCFSSIEQQARQQGVSVIPVTTLARCAESQDTKTLWIKGPWQFDNWSQERFRRSSIPDGAESNLPLSGVTLVESTRRIQGPLASHILAHLGATVLRIEPPNGDPLRGMPPVADGCSVRFNALNRSKQIHEINIKDPSGRQQVLELISNADLFLHNWAPHKAGELALDHEAMAVINPSIIYSYAGGWSASNRRLGQADQFPGTDFVVQAVSGVASSIADNDRAGRYRGGSLFTVLDTLGGMLSAQGMVAALLARALHGRGCYVETSLLGAANVLCDKALSKHYGVGISKIEPRTAEIVSTLTDEIVVDLDLALNNQQFAQHLFTPLVESCKSTGQPYEGQSGAEALKAFKLKSAEHWLKVFAELSIPAARLTVDISRIRQQSQLLPWLNQTTYEQVLSPWRFV